LRRRHVRYGQEQSITPGFVRVDFGGQIYMRRRVLDKYGGKYLARWRRLVKDDVLKIESKPAQSEAHGQVDRSQLSMAEMFRVVQQQVHSPGKSSPALP
jgi:hypothetical protein